MEFTIREMRDDEKIRAADTDPADSPGSLSFYKRNGDTVTEYARIEHVPPDYAGRAVTLWILAHPWRVATSVRMIAAYVALRRQQHLASAWRGQACNS